MSAKTDLSTSTRLLPESLSLSFPSPDESIAVCADVAARLSTGVSCSSIFVSSTSFIDSDELSNNPSADMESLSSILSGLGMGSSVERMSDINVSSMACAPSEVASSSS